MDNLVQVKLLFFAKSRELSGLSECFIDLPKTIVCANLCKQLTKTYNLEALEKKFLLALNNDYCDEPNAILNLKPEGFIKMNFLQLTEEKLDVNRVTDLVTHESCGAVSIFVGITRDNFEDKQVVQLKYEAFHTMAQKTLNKICDEIRNKWPDIKHIAIYHRLGVVPIKESSVIIAISSPHRQESLEAVQFAIDELKRTVPIWKKEVYGGNDEEIPNQPKKRPRRNKSNLSFKICCPLNNEIEVSKRLQQIKADSSEIKRRINCFVNQKRNEINNYNVQDFINDQTNENDKNANENDMTCARVNSTLYRAKGSKSHLKVHRVKNEYGPQTMNYRGALDKLMENVSPVKLKPDPDDPAAVSSLSIQERITNVEVHLNLPVEQLKMKSIVERIKAIEDKILYLETLSPEYSHFLDKSLQKATKSNSNVNLKGEKKTYTPADLDKLIEKLSKK